MLSRGLTLDGLTTSYFYRQVQASVPTAAALPSMSSGTKDVGGKDQNILLLGNDSRTGATAAELKALATTDDGGSTNTPDLEAASVRPAPVTARTTSELMESITGTSVDAPLCFTCGTKMRPSGSCYVCEGCGSTSGCS